MQKNYLMRNKMYLNLQYLRGIAAVAVVHFHIFHNTGYQGVAIFFVLSGFLMFDILNKHNKNALRFFSERYFRVAPLYYLTSIVVLMLGFAYDPTPLRIFQSFTFTALGAVHGVGWTLTYEFIFYTVVAICIALPINNKYKQYLVVIILLSGDYILSELLRSRGYAYGNYFYFFISGLIIYWVNKKEYLKKINPIVGCSVLLLSLFYLFLGGSLGLTRYPGDVNFDVENYLLASSLVVLFALGLEGCFDKKSFKWLETLGNASYSIYLTHMIFIKLFESHYDNINNWVLFLVTVLLGVFSYRIIEQPITNSIKKLRS
ncbi:acyltransferase family protein [Vibrio sp. 10N.286.49.B1]|uniref:acyltransferase family protein n=1 Tax=unclassified Vibrio TaxID=2614977 RepID=UPI0012FFF2CC|nr:MULTISPECIES: acyltransferase [unclassified Vibrio]